MNGEFQITLKSGEVVQFRFCTWSLKRFCELAGVKLEEMSQKLLSDVSLTTIVLMLQAAAEYCRRKTGNLEPIDDLMVSDWIDEAGGITAIAETVGKCLTAALIPEGAADQKKSQSAAKSRGRK